MGLTADHKSRDTLRHSAVGSGVHGRPLLRVLVGEKRQSSITLPTLVGSGQV